MIRNYITIAKRNLQRNKAYAIINVLGLTLGIACCLLIFTVITYHFSFDNFHANKDRIYQVTTAMQEEERVVYPGVPGPAGKALRNDFSFYEKTARIVTYPSTQVSIPQAGSAALKFKEEDGVAFTEPSFFDIFNFPLLIGDKRGMLAGPNEAVLTEKMARKYFGDAQAAIGKSIRFENKINFTVTGILKDLPGNTDFKANVFVSYGNLREQNEYTASDSSWTGFYSGCRAYVLLAPGTTSKQVQRGMEQLHDKYYKDDVRHEWNFELMPLSQVHFQPNFDTNGDRKKLWGLACIGFFLIVTACVNFINLSTAQALNRAKEVGVRKVMGGRRSQLFWQFIMETALVTLIAVVIACGVAFACVQPLNGLLNVHMSLHIFNGPLMIFLLGLTIMIIFFAGAYPGLVMARFQAVASLKGNLSQKSIGGFSLRRLLVITQFAIAQVLIIGAIVVAWQLYYSAHADLGFKKDAIVMVSMPTKDKSKVAMLRSRLQNLAGVKGVSFCLAAPASQYGNTSVVRYDTRPEEEKWNINVKDADDQYIPLFKLKLLAGRNLFPSDTAREYVVNETFMHKLNITNPQDLIGHQLEFDKGKKTGPVVGVLKDFRNTSFHHEVMPLVIRQASYQYNNCAVQLDVARLSASMSALENLWGKTFPDAVFSYEFVDDSIARFYEEDLMLLRLIQIFTGIAIFIGCLGLYGLAAFMAARKTKEIGVRKVLGAGVGQIIWLFGKEFTGLLLIAYTVAAPLGWWLMRSYLDGFKDRITLGPVVFLLAIGITFMIAMLTVGYRSVKSALINPVKSLTSE